METTGLSLYGVVTPAADILGAKQVFVITDFGGKDEENALMVQGAPQPEEQTPEAGPDGQGEE